MIKRIFILIFIFYSTSIFSQQLSFTVISSKDHMPVPYATIQLLNRQGAVIASEKGEFSFQFISTDSIEISSVGYRKLRVPVKELKKVIELSPQIGKMKPVKVYSKESSIRILLGSQRKSSKQDEVWGAGMKVEFAQRIELPDTSNEYHLRKLIIPVESNNCFSPFLIHIYLYDSLTDLPGEELFMTKVEMSKQLYKRGRAVIDIADENIILRGGAPFFLGFSWPPEINGSDRCLTGLKMVSDTVEQTYERSLYSKGYNFRLFTDDKPLISNSKNSVGIHRKLKTFFSVEADAFKVE